MLPDPRDCAGAGPAGRQEAALHEASVAAETRSARTRSRCEIWNLLAAITFPVVLTLNISGLVISGQVRARGALSKFPTPPLSSPGPLTTTQCPSAYSLP